VKTLEETNDGPTPRRATAIGVVVLWARDELGRSGEVLLCPDDEPYILGREGKGAASLLQQRPGTNRSTGPLTSARVSRRQLRLRRRDGALHVENLGSAPMRVDGRSMASATVPPGTLIEVHRRLLLWTVERPLEMAGEPPQRRHRFGEADAFGLVGEGPRIWALREQLAFVARRDAHVVVLGDSGVGKELAARALHGQSRRSDGPLVSRNAATLPEGLVDAELFGHARNYPNPGVPERSGLVGAADGGTLFLDEIGEMPVETQAHLLRVLDQGEYQRLGETRTRRADVRLVAATNRDPGELKHDLLARLKIRVRLPGLDERREDVLLLARHLLRRLAADDPELEERFFDGDEPRLAPELVRQLVVHRYATHVRELEGLLWDAMTRSSGDTLLGAPEQPEPEPGEVTKEQLREALAEADGVKTRAAELLGLRNRYQLLRLMKRLGVE